jgi:hypothetical protein
VHDNHWKSGNLETTCEEDWSSLWCVLSSFCGSNYNKALLSNICVRRSCQTWPQVSDVEIFRLCRRGVYHCLWMDWVPWMWRTIEIPFLNATKILQLSYILVASQGVWTLNIKPTLSESDPNCSALWGDMKTCERNHSYLYLWRKKVLSYVASGSNHRVSSTRRVFTFTCKLVSSWKCFS